jgi:hypothetical protein
MCHVNACARSWGRCETMELHDDITDHSIYVHMIPRCTTKRDEHHSKEYGFKVQ